MQIEVPVELLVVVGLLPAIGILCNLLFGECFVTAQLYGPTECSRTANRGRVAVVLILALCAWQYCTYLAWVLPSLPGAQWPKALLYHLLLLMWMHTYYSAATLTSVALEGRSGEECKKCSRSRPPGTHHCTVCGVCILGQDHHCIFINNCVGRRNRRYFVQMTGYTVAIALVLLRDCWGLLRRALTASSRWSGGEYNLFFGAFATAVIALGAGALFAVQVVLIPLGMTTVDLVAWMPATQRKGKEFRYESRTFRQMLRGVCGVMGPSVVHWVLPLPVAVPE